MPPGVSATVANNALNMTLNGIAWTGFATVFAQLHVATPGPNGTLGLAAETNRVSCGTAPAFATPVNGQTSNLNTLLWLAVVASETYSFISLWSSGTPGSGTFIASGVITSQPVVIGNNFSIPIGGLAVSLPIAS